MTSSLKHNLGLNILNCIRDTYLNIMSICPMWHIVFSQSIVVFEMLHNPSTLVVEVSKGLDLSGPVRVRSGSDPIRSGPFLYKSEIGLGFGRLLCEPSPIRIRKARAGTVTFNNLVKNIALTKYLKKYLLIL